MENGSNDRQLTRMPMMRPMGRKPSVPSGVVWMLIGCIASLTLPFLGVAVMAYGAREMVEAKSTRGFLLACAAGLVFVAVGFAADFAYGVSLAAELLCVLGIVWCMCNRHATVLGVSVVIMVVALFSIGVEMALAISAGSSLDGVVEGLTAVMTAAAQQTAGAGIAADMLVQQMQPILKAIWPFIYVGAAAMDALAAGVGSYLMHVRTEGAARFPSIAAFDMPLWPVGILAASIVGLGVASAGFPGSDVVLSVSATLLLSVRIIFAIQGFGVAIATADRMRFGCLGRFMLIFLSVQLEVMFFLLSIIGLIDVWANFRKLPRGDSGSKAHT